MARRLVLVLLILGLAGSAEALTIRDLMELSRAGLGDEVLLALIEVDRGVYDIDAETLKGLKAAGVSDRVIAALVRSGREAPPVPFPSEAEAYDGPAAPVPQVVVIEHHAEPFVREVAVPVPVYITAPAKRSGRAGGLRPLRPVESTYVPFQSGPPAERPRPVRQSREPVYWGFGGKLRPDAWQPAVRGSGRDKANGGEKPRGDGDTRR